MPASLIFAFSCVFPTFPHSPHLFTLSRILRAMIVSDNLPLHTDFPSTTPKHNTTKIMNNTLHTPAPWEHSAENAEAIAQKFLSTASELGSAIKWMSDNAYKCEQAKANPDIVDIITGDSALDILCALRGFAMALDRAALIKGEK